MTQNTEKQKAMNQFISEIQKGWDSIEKGSWIDLKQAEIEIGITKK